MSNKKLQNYGPMSIEPENPYAAPTVDGHAPSEADFPRRRGDVIRFARGNVLPRACIKTNRASGTWKYSFCVLPNAWGWLLLPMMFIPAIGAYCVMVAICALIWSGRAVQLHLWLHRPIALAFYLLSLCVVLFAIGGNLLIVWGFILNNAGWTFWGLVLPGIAVIGSSAPFQLFRYLEIELVEGKIVEIRHAHPDYLKRLDEEQ